MAHVDEALEHVGYEWWMFREVFDLLDGLPDDPDPVRNALLESLLIHGRVLGRFFTDFHGRRREDFNAEDSDVGVALVPEPAELTTWRQKMNGRVAHLLKDRVDPKQDWDAGTVRTFLDGRVAALKTQVVNSVPADWIGDRATGSKLLKPGAKSAAGVLSPTMPAPGHVPAAPLPPAGLPGVTGPKGGSP